MCSTLSLRHFPYIAFEIVPLFIWLMMALSCPLKEDRLTPKVPLYCGDYRCIGLYLDAVLTAYSCKMHGILTFFPTSMLFLFLANPPGFENNFEVTTSRIGVTNEYQCNVRVISPISRASASSLDLVILVSVHEYIIFVPVSFLPPPPHPLFFLFLKRRHFLVTQKISTGVLMAIHPEFWTFHNVPAPTPYPPPSKNISMTLNPESDLTCAYH